MLYSGIKTSRHLAFIIYINVVWCVVAWHMMGILIVNILSFRVPFQQALSLVGSRGAYLEGGFAFVPLARLVSTVVTRVSV